MDAFLNRRIDVEVWLVYSTIASVFLFIKVFHAGIDVFAGYPVVIFNTLLLLVLGRLVIHQIHAIVIGAVTIISLAAAHFSSTPVTSILAQTIGMSLFSVCYFSVLLTSRLTVPRWIDLYARFAFFLAFYGIVENLALRALHPLVGHRLTAGFEEPSFFVYTTLPAIGYFINAWVSERRYGVETLIFLFAYILADSSLGFMGLLLIAAFTLIRRFTMWHIMAGLLGCGIVLVGLFLASENVRLRATDTFFAISNQSLARTNASTFAFLSNLYVAGNAFVDHPVLGVGIGGYRSTYDFYIRDLGDEDLRDNIDSIGLNMDDANSLFLRVIAELGPLGLIALLGFLVVCARVDGKPYRQIRNALLPYMLVRMARFGAYFSMELYFFVGLYLLNYLDYRRTVARPKIEGLALNTTFRPA